MAPTKLVNGSLLGCPGSESCRDCGFELQEWESRGPRWPGYWWCVVKVSESRWRASELQRQVWAAPSELGAPTAARTLCRRCLRSEVSWRCKCPYSDVQPTVVRSNPRLATSRVQANNAWSDGSTAHTIAYQCNLVTDQSPYISFSCCYEAFCCYCVTTGRQGTFVMVSVT